MMQDLFEQTIEEIVGQGHVLTEEPMKAHTTFRIGGPAAYYVIPQSVYEVRPVIQACEDAGIPWYILGNGSNLLVRDAGYRGVVIQLDRNVQQIEVEGTTIRAEAGALLSKIAAEARDASLAGLEFASGIPGTLGGAAAMNAGAYGSEMRDVLTACCVLDQNLDEKVVPVSDLDLGYRKSRIAKEGWIVLSAELQLQPGQKEAISARMEELREARRTKQPLEFPSAGSTFKRPEGYYAGKLIMDAGLRGYTVGDAQVSEKHCGFVINRGHATCDDVCKLIEHVQKTVWDKFQVHLEPEVRILGN